jgi:hypothetical protein
VGFEERNNSKKRGTIMTGISKKTCLYVSIIVISVVSILLANQVYASTLDLLGIS